MLRIGIWSFTTITFIMEIDQKYWQQQLIKTMSSEDTDRADGWFMMVNDT